MKWGQAPLGKPFFASPDLLPIPGLGSLLDILELNVVLFVDFISGI